MTVIIILILVVVIEGLLPFADAMLNDLWNIVFNIKSVIPTSWFSDFVSEISKTFYSVGVALLVIKFLKKMFDIYVLWSDGDPDVEPLQLVINFVKAMVTAICFPYIWNVFVQVGKEVLDSTMNLLNASGGSLSEQWAQANWTTMGLVPVIFGLIFLICMIILFFQFVKRGLELMLMIIGVPLACIGLLDNDHGIFRPYCNQFSKILISTLFQIIVAKIGLTLALTIDLGNFSGAIMVLLIAICCMTTSIKLSATLQEFMVPMTHGGGAMSKIYGVSMMSNLIRNFAR